MKYDNMEKLKAFLGTSQGTEVKQSVDSRLGEKTSYIGYYWYNKKLLNSNSEFSAKVVNRSHWYGDEMKSGKGTVTLALPDKQDVNKRIDVKNVEELKNIILESDNWTLYKYTTIFPGGEPPIAHQMFGGQEKKLKYYIRHLSGLKLEDIEAKLEEPEKEPMSEEKRAEIRRNIKLKFKTFGELCGELVEIEKKEGREGSFCFSLHRSRAVMRYFANGELVWYKDPENNYLILPSEIEGGEDLESFKRQLCDADNWSVLEPAEISKIKTRMKPINQIKRYGDALTIWGFYGKDKKLNELCRKLNKKGRWYNIKLSRDRYFRNMWYRSGDIAVLLPTEISEILKGDERIILTPANWRKLDYRPAMDVKDRIITLEDYFKKVEYKKFRIRSGQ